MTTGSSDCIIVGGGPAGLTAALYLARFHLSVRLLDTGDSRVDWIPRTNNLAGYVEGIEGRELRRRMRTHAERYGVRVEERRVDMIEMAGDGFVLRAGDERLEARTVLLATGVVNNRPDVADDGHSEALERRLLRYCPVCDGYEVTDRRIAALGTGERGVREAIFLRGYTADVTLLPPPEGHVLTDGERTRLAEAGIVVADGLLAPLEIEREGIVAPVGGARLRFDSIYPALGSRIRSELAVATGADASEDGCMSVDDHQETSLPGMFAAGDVVFGLDQIASAMGQAAVAATTIRNRLAERRPIRR